MAVTVPVPVPVSVVVTVVEVEVDGLVEEEVVVEVVDEVLIEGVEEVVEEVVLELPLLTFENFVDLDLENNSEGEGSVWNPDPRSLSSTPTVGNIFLPFSLESLSPT